MLKIYGADLSAPANKVRMAANILGMDYEYRRVSIRDKENRSDEYLKMHPAGKVPVIDDDGFTLFESDAIVKYLAAKQRTPLYPDEPIQKALIDQWMDFVAIHIGGAMGRVVFNRVFASFARVSVDERSMQDGQKFLNRFLPVIDRQLAKNKYLAGETLTLADISLLATLDPAEVAGVDLSPYAHITKWRAQFQGQEFYTRCHASYAEALKKVMANA